MVEHDTRCSCTLLYVGLALVLSTAISLFWLVAGVAAHGLFEWLAVSFACTCAVLILVAPLLPQHTMGSVLASMAADLSPWLGP